MYLGGCYLQVSTKGVCSALVPFKLVMFNNWGGRNFHQICFEVKYQGDIPQVLFLNYDYENSSLKLSAKWEESLVLGVFPAFYCSHFMFLFNQ